MFFNRLNQKIILCNEKFEIIKDNVKLKHIPREGEYVFFGDERVYWLVYKIIYNISSTNIIWVVVIPTEQNQNG
jgi:hypothetical protein